MRLWLLEWLARGRHEPSVELALRGALDDPSAMCRLFAAESLGELEVPSRLVQKGADPARGRARDALIRLAPDSAATRVALAWALRSRVPADRPLREATLEAIAASAVEGFEDLLVEVLDEEDDDLRLLAIRALEKVGTLNAVVPLMPFRDRVLASQVKDSARAAIAAIQGRAGGGERGALALVVEGGALALVDPGQD